MCLSALLQSWDETLYVSPITLLSARLTSQDACGVQRDVATKVTGPGSKV